MIAKKHHSIPSQEQCENEVDDNGDVQIDEESNNANFFNPSHDSNERITDPGQDHLNNTIDTTIKGTTNLS